MNIRYSKIFAHFHTINPKIPMVISSEIFTKTNDANRSAWTMFFYLSRS